MIYVYFLPFENSSLAHYVSRHDPWYRRHVHSVFYYKNFMPDDNYLSYLDKIDTKKKEKSKGEKNLDKEEIKYKRISPFNLEYQFLNKAMQQYYTFANQNLKIPIYRVECSERKNQLTGKNRVLYFFCESLHIGQEVLLTHSQKSKEAKNLSSYKERFKMEEEPKILDVKIKYREAVEDTTIIQRDENDKRKDLEFVEINKKVARLGFYSVPGRKPHDPGYFSPSPSKPLFMSLLDEGGWKQRDLMASDQNFMKAPKKLQESYFASLYSTAFISEVEVITNSFSSNLLILADNRIYGEFSHLRISPVYSKDYKRLAFNLRTFLKVE